MFEHVGVANYDEYFNKVRDLLKDDGVMDAARDRPLGAARARPIRGSRNTFSPAATFPALSEVTAAIERSGLFVTDIEILRLHYADTLKAWRERFNAHRDEIRAMYDERFCRMWEFYLVGSEISFRVYGHMVFQIQLAKRQDVCRARATTSASARRNCASAKARRARCGGWRASAARPFPPCGGRWPAKRPDEGSRRKAHSPRAASGTRRERASDSDAQRPRLTARPLIRHASRDTFPRKGGRGATFKTATIAAAALASAGAGGVNRSLRSASGVSR